MMNPLFGCMCYSHDALVQDCLESLALFQGSSPGFWHYIIATLCNKHSV